MLKEARWGLDHTAPCSLYKHVGGVAERSVNNFHCFTVLTANLKIFCGHQGRFFNSKLQINFIHFNKQNQVTWGEGT